MQFSDGYQMSNMVRHAAAEHVRSSTSIHGGEKSRPFTLKLIAAIISVWSVPTRRHRDERFACSKGDDAAIIKLHFRSAESIFTSHNLEFNDLNDTK
jgi:hypothetical protein